MISLILIFVFILFSSKSNAWTHALIVSKLFLIMGRIIVYTNM